jgi:hypothetical protein
MDDSKKCPLNNTSSFLVATNADKSSLCTRLLVTTNTPASVLTLPSSADATVASFLFSFLSLGGCESASTSARPFAVFFFQICLMHRMRYIKCFIWLFCYVMSRMGNYILDCGQVLPGNDCRPENFAETFCS